MPMTAVPLRVVTDPVHGGRWTSLRGGDREWLWRRADPARDAVRPGQDFVDAGGLEECVPTVRGVPDHGDAWSRRWRVDGRTAVVECPRFTLSRRLDERAGAVVAGYRLAADPGFRFLWAGHALLDVGPRADLVVPDGVPVRIFPEAAPYLAEPWPAGARWRAGRWPRPLGLPLHRLGPDDGSAIGAVLGPLTEDQRELRVRDGADVLRLRLDAADQPVSFALWRNLGGFPAGAPYRSIGVEPMLGTVFDLAEAGAGDAAVVPAGGQLSWRLTVRAERHPGRP